MMTPLTSVLRFVSNFVLQHLPPLLEITLHSLARRVFVVLTELGMNLRRELHCRLKTALFTMGPPLQRTEIPISHKVVLVSPKTTQKFLRLIDRTRSAQLACLLSNLPVPPNFGNN